MRNLFTIITLHNLKSILSLTVNSIFSFQVREGRVYWLSGRYYIKQSALQEPRLGESGIMKHE